MRESKKKGIVETPKIRHLRKPIGHTIPFLKVLPMSYFRFIVQLWAPKLNQPGLLRGPPTTHSALLS